MSLESHVLVVGAGPSGSAAALVLAAAGLKVLLVEQSRFEETRVGELISPEGLQVLRAVLPEELERFLIRPLLIASAWESPELSIVDHTVEEPWWALRRLDLDRALAERAVEMGAELLLGSRVRDLQRSPSGGWRFQIRDEGSEDRPSRRASFVIDATGRGFQVARSLGASRRKLDSQTALVGFLEGVGELADEMLLETTERGWWYAAPLETGRAVAVFITDNDLDRGRPEQAWEIAWAESTHLRQRYSGYRLLATPKRGSADSSICFPSSGPDWAATGDAAFAHDPLSNLGIGRAVFEGVRLAQSLVDSVQQGRPFSGALFAEDSGYKFQTDSAALKANYRQVLHWPESEFWRRRTGGRLKGGLNGQVRAHRRSEPELRFPVQERFECTRCGYCCSTPWAPVLEPMEWKPTRATYSALPEPRSSELELFEVGPDARVRLAKDPQGRCVALSSDRLCSLHTTEGATAKPVDCRLFPFEVRETPDGLIVGVSHLCRAVAGNIGAPLESYRNELAELLADFPTSVVSEKVPVTWGRALDWAQYLDWQGYLLTSPEPFRAARTGRWLLALWACRESLETAPSPNGIASQPPPPMAQLVALDELLALELQARHPAEPPEQHSEAVQSFLAGEAVRFRRSPGKGLPTVGDLGPLGAAALEVHPEALRYGRSLLQRHALLDGLPLVHNLCLFSALPHLLSWQLRIADASTESGSESGNAVAPELVREAIAELELRWFTHQRDDSPAHRIAGYQLEDAYSSQL